MPSVILYLQIFIFITLGDDYIGIHIWRSKIFSKIVPVVGFTTDPDGCPLVPLPDKTSGDTASTDAFEMLLTEVTLLPVPLFDPPLPGIKFWVLPCTGP